MTPELWQQLKPLYEAALEIPGPDRGRFVAEACGSDDVLRRELTALLRAHDEPTGPDDAPLVDLGVIFPGRSSIFSTGDLVMDRFRIVRHVGDGGMGSVYEAMDLEMGRIALKTIRADAVASSDLLARFKKEVLLARKVSGPHICRIHEWFATDNHQGFLTMEFLEGMTLADKLRESGPFQWREAKTIALEICAGLQTIHDAGIIHRDLKCRNIMLAKRNGGNRAVLMDFGLAREFTRIGSGETTRSTPDIAIVGTPDYMAPEQFEGKDLSPATDIYALGIVLYELVTAKHPYAASTPIEAAIHRARRPAPASAIQRKLPRNWDRIIDCCLEYEPSRRYSSASEVARELRAGPVNLGNIRKDRPWVLRLAALLALAGLAWCAYLWWHSRQYYRPGAEAQRWYESGVSALREGSYLKATRLLTTAVNQDEQYAMAHARLAEAWADLDFDGNAQREMLIATAGERRLTPLDSEYMNAIRATLTRNFSEAVVLYGRILHELPATEKPAGYVDLGRAEERAGNPQKALADYGRAASLDKDNAAAYMNTAVLESRLHNVPAADAAFNQAEAIFSSEINQEGIAELHYERGYLANVNGDLEQAEHFLNRSLEEAKQIKSVQLEIRILTQLSNVTCSSGNNLQAINFAQKAIQLARNNQLDAWAANGLARLANAQLMEGDEHFHEAEEAIEEALNLAHESRQSRAEALANLVLASLRDAEQRSDEVIPPAQAALTYYQQNGYFEPAAEATLLLLRAQKSRGDFKSTLQTANSFVALANQSGSRYLLMQGEDALGGTYDSAESYPEALSHFQKARELAVSTTDLAYETVACAEILVKLGRLAEAESLLHSIDGNESVTTEIGKVRVKALLIHENYRPALNLVLGLISKYPEMTMDTKEELQDYQMIAEAHLGHEAEVLEQLTKASAVENRRNGPGYTAISELRTAEVYLALGKEQMARNTAIAAEQYFATTGQLDSRLRSALFVALSAHILQDDPTLKVYSSKAVDILSILKDNWGPQAYRTYLSRPDIRSLLRVLPPQGPGRSNGT